MGRRALIAHDQPPRYFMKSRSPDPAETQFEAYLKERGIAGGDDHHPDLGGTKKPDYRISRGTSVAIIEVRGLETSRLHDRLSESTAVERER